MEQPGATRHREATGLDVTTSRTGEIATVVVVGDVDSASAGLVIDACDAEIAAGASSIRLDLSQTSFVDSSGLVVLLDVRAATTNAGVALKLPRPSRAVRRVLELTELVSVFDLET
jgi:anti-sigma B factor antagonist